MNDQQRASFEAWYMQHNKLVPTCPAKWVFTTFMDSREYADKNVQIAYEAWQAALESPEVQALRDALQAMLEVHGVTQAYADKHPEIPQSWVEVSDLARAALAQNQG